MIDWVQCHQIYGAVILRPRHKEALHVGVHVHHPDGTKTPLGTHGTEESKKLVSEAIKRYDRTSSGA